MDAAWPTAADAHTLTDLSWLTGIAVPNLSAYRRGTRRMSAETAETVTLAAATAPQGLVARARLLGYPQLAREVGRHGVTDEVHCTRLTRQTVDQLGRLTDDRDIVAYHLRPPSTGDERWDMLIAGVASYTWARYRDEPLRWTLGSGRLPEPWAPGHMPSRRLLWDLVNTPQPLRERNVVFSTAFLEAV